jgi:hypothetical protein
MSKRMDWSQARPYRPRETKTPAGTILSNGERVPWLPKDDLAKRADLAMREWLRSLTPRDRARLAR